MHFGLVLGMGGRKVDMCSVNVSEQRFTDLKETGYKDENAEDK